MRPSQEGFDTPRTLKEIIDIEMRDGTLSKMQAEKSLEYAIDEMLEYLMYLMKTNEAHEVISVEVLKEESNA